MSVLVVLMLSLFSQSLMAQDIPVESHATHDLSTLSNYLCAAKGCEPKPSVQAPVLAEISSLAAPELTMDVLINEVQNTCAMLQSILPGMRSYLFPDESGAMEPLMRFSDVTPGFENRVPSPSHGPVITKEMLRNNIAQVLKVDLCTPELLPGLLNQCLNALMTPDRNSFIDIFRQYASLSKTKQQHAKVLQQLEKVEKDFAQLNSKKRAHRKLLRSAAKTISAYKQPTVTELLSCMQSEKQVLGKYIDLYFYAAYRSPFAMTVTTKRDELLQRCSKKETAEIAADAAKIMLCILKELNVPAPDKVLSIFENHKMAVVGFDKELLEYIERNLLVENEKLVKASSVRAIMPFSRDNNSATNGRYAYETQTIYVAAQSMNRAIDNAQQRFAPGIDATLRRRLARDSVEELIKYCLVHETAHAVDDCQGDDSPGPLSFRTMKNGMVGWKKSGMASMEGMTAWTPVDDSIRKCTDDVKQPRSEYDPTKIPTTYEQINNSIFQKHGFVTQYAATNVAEDWAESMTAYILNPKLLMEVHPGKFNFMKEVLENNQRQCGAKAAVP